MSLAANAQTKEKQSTVNISFDCCLFRQNFEHVKASLIPDFVEVARVSFVVRHKLFLIFLSDRGRLEHLPFAICWTRLVGGILLKTLKCFEVMLNIFKISHM